ncbi:CapA family protein [Pelotomaculum isophthalicicum JI]|uniref:CapA family protein n=1 Tax=Pelotomaculum isophthalicicum JI TaxID=947010 RepID=A0A9X4GXJ0_9FIRM|nr:CapA family protein [Pelotomaculum isophthalicicum]MDF9406787.1 CapA family protein [Pelotomaculum isophthalicicum JI]
MNKTAEIAIVGDLALHYGPQKCDKDILDCLGSMSFVIACLEAPICSYGTGPKYKKRTVFRIDPSRAERLKKYNLKVVSCANNHIMDFGKRGIAETLTILNKIDISPIGLKTPSANHTFVDLKEPFKMRIAAGMGKGLSIGSFYISSIKDVANALKKAPEDVLRIAYLHGGTEYVSFPDPHQFRETLHLLRECRVDIICWSHSHAPAPFTVKGGVFIAWGLGNWDLTSPENRQRNVSKRALALTISRMETIGLNNLLTAFERRILPDGNKDVLHKSTYEWSQRIISNISCEEIAEIHKKWAEIDACVWLPQTCAAIKWRIQKYGYRTVVKDLIKIILSGRWWKALYKINFDRMNEACAEWDGFKKSLR